jgi:hypothetical protein
MKVLLWIGLAVCFTYGFFWRGMYENGFFVLQAVSFFLLSLFIHQKERCFISYLWLAYSINNLVDEFIGTPTRIDINEKIIIVITLLVWLIIRIWNERQNNRRSN